MDAGAPDVAEGSMSNELDLREERTENHVKLNCVAYLEYIGCRVARSNAGMMIGAGGCMRLAPTGWPDITGAAPDGKAIWVECKSPRRKAPAWDMASDEQCANLEWLDACDGYAYCVKSVHELIVLMEATRD